MDLKVFLIEGFGLQRDLQQQYITGISHTYLGLNLFCFDKILAVTCVLQLRLYYSFGLLSAVSASAAHWPRFRCVRVQEQAREMQLKITIRNAKCYLGVSGSLWLLFVIGSKFKTAFSFPAMLAGPEFTDLSGDLSIQNNVFWHRWKCVNSPIFQPKCQDPVNEMLFCCTLLPLFYFFLVKNSCS